MSDAITSQREIDGSVECPGCGEDLAEANLRVKRPKRGVSSARIIGGSGNVWLHAEVECDECGEAFEVGGQIGITG